MSVFYFLAPYESSLNRRNARACLWLWDGRKLKCAKVFPSCEEVFDLSFRIWRNDSMEGELPDKLYLLKTPARHYFTLNECIRFQNIRTIAEFLSARERLVRIDERIHFYYVENVSLEELRKLKVIADAGLGYLLKRVSLEEAYAQALMRSL